MNNAIYKTINRLKNKNVLIGAAIVISAILTVYIYLKYSEVFPTTDNAYVGAKIVNVAAKTSGYIDSVMVKNNQKVRKSDILFLVDPSDYKIALEQAQKNYDASQVTLEMAKQQIEVAKLELNNAKNKLQLIQDTEKRHLAMLKIKTIAKQTYKETKNQLQNAKNQVSIEQSKYHQAVENYKYRETELAIMQANLDKSRLDLEYTKYRSPVNGIVTNLNHLAKGELIGKGQQLFGLVDDENWWVDANFKETQIARIKIGQPASITLDMYDHQYVGIVDSISHASGSTFSLLPAQNATGNWVKVTQRFTVRIKIENNNNHPLMVGASAKVRIDTRN